MIGKTSDGMAPRWYTRDVWQKPDRTKSILRRTRTVTEVNNHKGDVLPSPSNYRPIPAQTLDKLMQSIILASGPIALAGSFAENITDGGFRHTPGFGSTDIYYDGTHESRIIKQRRSDGFVEPLPPGKVTIAFLPEGQAGAPGPIFYVWPFFTPGTCNIGWVMGDVGEPRIAHLTPLADAAAQQRIRGREPLSDGPLLIQLLAVPEVALPGDGTQVGDDAENGTLAMTLLSPGMGATNVPHTFRVRANAADKLPHYPKGWNVFINAVLKYSTEGPTSDLDIMLTMPDGLWTLRVEVWNDLGTMTAIENQFRIPTTEVTDPTPTPTPTPPTNPYPQPDPTQPFPPGYCVMLGTEILPLGDSKWWTQEFPEAEWFRLFTSSGRELSATPNHPVYTARAGQTELRDVRKGDIVVTVNGEERVEDIRSFQRPGVKVCVHMDAGHLYWANGILSHNKVYGY